jgi:hypothetical protein
MNNLQELFERISTRYCWNKIKISEEKIIDWMKTLSPIELTKQIEYSKTPNTNNFIIAIETLSFDVADYIYDFNKTYAVSDWPNTFWYIMITLFNQNIEEKNPELFIKGCNLFCKILDIYDIKKIHNSALHISIRFKTILFTKKLVEKGLSLKYYDWGLSPLLTLINYTINNNFNKEMFDYILSNGSSIDEITKHDDIDPKKRTGPSSYCGFLIKKTNGLLLKDSIHKNVLDIILMSYDILLKYGILIDNPVHPIYDLIKYFNIKIKINKYECCICMVEDDIKLEQLHCSHFICINCAINIQEDDKIVCPFCRKINDYFDNPYLISLAIATIGKNYGEIQIKKETTVEQLIKICQNKIGYKNITLRVDNKIIPNTNQSVNKIGIKNNSLICCNLIIKI